MGYITNYGSGVTLEAGTITDGTFSVASGAITGATTIGMGGALSGCTGLTMVTGNISMTAGDVNASSGTVTGSTVTDGTATLTGGALSSATLTQPKFADGGYIADAGGDKMIVFQEDATPVNYLEVFNADSSVNVIVAANGTDTDVNLELKTKAAGDIVLNAGTGDVDANSHKITNVSAAGATGDALAYGRAANVTTLTCTSTLDVTGKASLDGDVDLGDTSGDAIAVLGTMTMTNAALVMNSNQITGLADPTLAQDAATKTYVDSYAAGLKVKAAVRVLEVSPSSIGTTYNWNATNKQHTWATGPTAVDGITLANDDRILVNISGADATNGIFVRTDAETWDRASDMDASAELQGGIFAFVQEGSTYEDLGFVLINDSAITLDTTALEFTQFTGAHGITAGSGITKSGNTLSVTTAGITNAMLGADIVTGDEIADNAVGVEHIGFINTAATTSGFILVADGTDYESVAISGDATLSSAGALTINGSAVETAMINDTAVTTAKIADANVTTAKIADANVTTAKIADAAVTAVKIHYAEQEVGATTATTAASPLVSCDSSATGANAAITLSLAHPDTGVDHYVVWDSAGNSATNAITIIPEVVNSGTSIATTNGTQVTLASGGGTNAKVGMYLKMTSGSGSGNGGYVTAVAGDVMTVSITGPPAATDTYALYAGTIDGSPTGSKVLAGAYNSFNVFGTGSQNSACKFIIA